MPSRKIYIDENKLLDIKDRISNDVDTVSKDEYTIGSEGGNNDFFHVTESYGRNQSVDVQSIDRIDYCPHDDPKEEGYEEDEEFIPFYDIEAFDRNGDRLFWDEVSQDDLEEVFGANITNAIINKEGRKLNDKWFILDDIISTINTESVDINDVNAVNRQAKRMSVNNGESAYLLTDGSVVRFFDHRYISEIDGMTIGKFLDLGNIRIGKSGFEICKEPTNAQWQVLREIIPSFNECYVDVCKNSDGEFYPTSIFSINYGNTNPNYIINTLKRYFREGIKPSEVDVYESLVRENMEMEVSADEVNLSSFRKNDKLADKIWNGNKLNSRVRLKLLDLADDFWDYISTKWVKRKAIMLTGSICNYNWSKFSDIDVHIVVDFSEVDERTDFVREYYNSKKNDWNSTHDKLKIYGHTVEFYIEDVDDVTESTGKYDLEKNEWVSEPEVSDVKEIGLNKYDIKNISSKLMTKIDDIEEDISKTSDNAILRALNKRSRSLLNKIKAIRKYGLKRSGEGDTYNIVYKVLRRSGYLDKLYSIINLSYDAENSLDESGWIKADSLLDEEVVADGNASHNPFRARWKQEREVLKGYLSKYGQIMTSKENGKQYKVIYDKMLSQNLGINYCICIQWNPITMETGNIIYVRAYDKFTTRLFRPEFDTRGFDNVEGSADDIA